MSEFGVVLFHTTSAALRAEKVLQKAKVTTKLIPVPREFSSDCGIALRFVWAGHQAVLDELTTQRVEIASIHQLS